MKKFKINGREFHVHGPECLKTVRLEDTKGKKAWLDYCTINLSPVSVRPHGNTDPIKALKKLISN